MESNSASEFNAANLQEASQCGCCLIAHPSIALCADSKRAEVHVHAGHVFALRPFRYPCDRRLIFLI